MGVKYGIKLVDQLLMLTFSQFFTIARDRAEKNGRPGKPVLDIDASWLWYKFRSRAGGPIGNIIDFVRFLATDGFTVCVVCDSDERHHSKRASIERRVEREHARFMAIEARALIMRISIKLRERAYDTEAERADLESRRDWMSKYATADENLEESSPPDDFFAQLRDSLDTGSIGHRGGSITVLKAVSQADFYIAYRVERKLTDVVVSNDNDYAILARHALCMADFVFNSKKSGGYMYNIRITSPCSNIMTRAAEATRIDTREENDNFKPAAVRLLDNASPRLRCLFAVGAGCDSFPGGVSNVGIPTIFKKYHAEGSPAAYGDMLDWFAKALAKGTPSEGRAAAVAARKEMLETFVDSLMYEPADATRDSDGRATFEYIHDEPTLLPEYLRA